MTVSEKCIPFVWCPALWSRISKNGSARKRRLIRWSLGRIHRYRSHWMSNQHYHQPTYGKIHRRQTYTALKTLVRLGWPLARNHCKIVFHCQMTLKPWQFAASLSTMWVWSMELLHQNWIIQTTVLKLLVSVLLTREDRLSDDGNLWISAVDIWEFY